MTDRQATRRREHDEVADTNFSSNPTFGSIVETRLSRRALLRGTAGAGPVSVSRRVSDRCSARTIFRTSRERPMSGVGGTGSVPGAPGLKPRPRELAAMICFTAPLG